MAASLPQEIIDQIIDHLWKDKPALSACALTSRSWIPTSRHHLFHILSLSISRAKDRSPALLEILSSPRCTIRGGGVVRRLEISGITSTLAGMGSVGCKGKGPYEPRDVNGLLGVIPLFGFGAGGLRELRLSNIDWGHVEERGDLERMGGGENASVRELWLEQVVFEDEGRARRVLGAFGGLEVLRWKDISGYDGVPVGRVGDATSLGAVPPNRRGPDDRNANDTSCAASRLDGGGIPTTLKKLILDTTSLHSPTTRALLMSLAKRVPHLSLSLYESQPSLVDFTYINAFLRALGERLRHLTYDVSLLWVLMMIHIADVNVSWGTTRPSAIPSISLHASTGLSSISFGRIRLRDPVWTVSPNTYALVSPATLISQIRSPHLQEISLAIDFTGTDLTGVDDFDWGALDGEIGRSVYCEGLREVRIWVYGAGFGGEGRMGEGEMEGVVRVVRMRMKCCERRGILRFVNGRPGQSDH